MAEWRRSRGFSFLEILVALAILGSAFTVLLSAQASAVRKQAYARHLMTATLLARELLTEIETGRELTNESQDFGEEFPGYAWEIQVEPANLPIDMAMGSSPGAPGFGLAPDLLKEVRIRVTWPEGGRTGSTELIFYAVTL
jgi:prepilin-type N-terminal cleavage/methylation domain-containing protein